MGLARLLSFSSLLIFAVLVTGCGSTKPSGSESGFGTASATLDSTAAITQKKIHDTDKAQLLQDVKDWLEFHGLQDEPEFLLWLQG